MGEIAIDPVAVVVAVITLLVGPKLAVYLGPYMVIAAAGFTGAAISLSRREPDAKPGTWQFLALMVSMSMLVTVGITKLSAMLWAPLGSDFMLVLVALLVGFIGDDWPAVLKWAISRIRGRLDKKAEAE